MHHGGGGGGGGGGYGGHSHGGHHAGHTSHATHHHGGAPSQSASWNMAMQAPEFWVKLLKEKQKPLIAVVVVTMTLVLWLYMINFLNGKENPHHVVSRDVWNQQLTSADPRAVAPEYSQDASQSGMANPNQATSAFGAPISAYGAQATAQPAYAQQSFQPAYASLGSAQSAGYPSGASASMTSAMLSSFMPGGYSAAQNPMAQSMGASPYGSSMRNQSLGVMPMRQHSAERFKVVVQR